MNTQNAEAEGLKELHPGPYRINRYRITVNEDRSISWQTPGGMDRIIGGQGRIESDILFLEPRVDGEVKQSKQDFHYHLSRLPQWTITTAWCRHSTLRSCREEQKVKFSRKISTPPKEAIDPVGLKHHFIFTQNQKNETPPKQPSFNFTPLKSWSSFSSWLNKFKWPKLSRPWSY
jgi:hypothetical protein